MPAQVFFAEGFAKGFWRACLCTLDRNCAGAEWALLASLIPGVQEASCAHLAAGSSHYILDAA